MEEWSWSVFFAENRTVMGGAFIAIATVVAVFVNSWLSKASERRAQRQKDASFASVLAAEMADNAHNLVGLYLELERKNTRAHKMDEYTYLAQPAYETLLAQIGQLGPSLSYLVVDTNGDIAKLKRRIENQSYKNLTSDKSALLPEIQAVIAKALSTAIIIAMYADYLNGHRFLKETKSKHMLWIDRLMDEFCRYVAKTQDNIRVIETPPSEEDDEPNFRFNNDGYTQKLEDLYQQISFAYDKIRRKPAWKTQLLLRALSFQMYNTFMNFLQLIPDDYDLLAEKEYAPLLAA